MFYINETNIVGTKVFYDIVRREAVTCKNILPEKYIRTCLMMYVIGVVRTIFFKFKINVSYLKCTINKLIKLNENMHYNICFPWAKVTCTECYT